MQDPSDNKVEWILPIVEKREILGDTRKEAGGPSPGGGEDGAAGKRGPAELEPVSWHGNGIPFWKEVLRAYWACTCTDLTPQGDALPLACIQLNVKYVALCNNSVHQRKLQDRLVERVMALMQDAECSELYESVMVADLAPPLEEPGPDGVVPNPNPNPNPHPGKGGRGGKGKRRGKGGGKNTGKGKGSGKGVKTKLKLRPGGGKSGKAGRKGKKNKDEETGGEAGGEGEDEEEADETTEGWKNLFFSFFVGFLLPQRPQDVQYF